MGDHWNPVPFNGTGGCQKVHTFLPMFKPSRIMLVSMAKSPTDAETFTSTWYFPATTQANMLDRLVGA